MTADEARFYLHGDESETARGSYYCRKCDAFRHAAHFDAPCLGESHASIYDHHYRNFLAISRLAHVNRPASAPSLADRFR